MEDREVVCMGSEKDNAGIKCNIRCYLIGLDGGTHYARLGDISESGALLMMSDEDAQESLHVGEMCGLVFRDKHNMNPEKHTGKIIRLESGQVEVSFTHQEHRYLKNK
jgi:hypothetical protein